MKEQPPKPRPLPSFLAHTMACEEAGLAEVRLEKLQGQQANDSVKAAIKYHRMGYEIREEPFEYVATMPVEEVKAIKAGILAKSQRVRPSTKLEPEGGVRELKFANVDAMSAQEFLAPQTTD